MKELVLISGKKRPLNMAKLALVRAGFKSSKIDNDDTGNSNYVLSYEGLNVELKVKEVLSKLDADVIFKVSARVLTIEEMDKWVV